MSAESMIRAFQAGDQAYQAEQRRLREQEDRKLRMDILNHQLNQEKISEKLSARNVQLQEAQSMEGQGVGINLPSLNISGAQIPGEELPAAPMTIQGVPELGLPERQISPRTPAEQFAHQLTQARMKAMITPEKLKPGEIYGFPGQPPLMSGGAQEPTDDFGRYFLPAYAEKLGKNPANLSPDEKIAAFSSFTQAKADPEVRAAALAQKNLAISLQQIQLSQQPTPEQAQTLAKSLVNHQIAPDQLTILGGFGVQGQTFKRMIVTNALKMEPNFDFEQASAEYNLVKSPQFQQQIRFIDHVSNTLPRLEASAKALGNTSIKQLNKLLVGGQTQFGGTNIKTFLTDREVVANELGRVLSGGGTGNQTSDAKIETARDLVSSSDSPAQIAATIAEMKPLLQSRRATLTRGTYLENTNTALERSNPAGTPETAKPQILVGPGGKTLSLQSDGTYQ